MKVLAVLGSKRTKGNTASLIEQALIPFQELDYFSGETLFLGDMEFDGCTGCEGCARSNRCVIDDDMQHAYSLLREADAVIIGSPTYFYNVTSDMKKFIDRCYCFSSYNPKDRSVWTAEFDSGPRKFAGFISICEQNSVDDMGYTPQILQKSFESLGFRTVFNQKVLHCFKAGEVKSRTEAMESAQSNGRKLRDTLILQSPETHHLSTTLIP
ncbi:flavodoxin family protein [Oceanispirochaeta sp.]|jgi:multimeric flavodoxin WrbA|uniref:flavodoxin family protein n=1 Tax=Oceanispirochaeta sp. TaxID=2035350 RepID=UPI002605FDF6|nr:flavodoxin family protein [Oceanispirochaeta sp.]MDA3957038.1 flavodoxin family protein [Oceanispirochaeta sp.]